MDEYLEAYFQHLGSGQGYARAQWAYINGNGPQPDYRAYGLQDADAQAIRIRLAQLR